MRFWLWVALVGCRAGTPYEGVLKDRFSGEPLPQVRVVAKSIGTANDMTCISRDATTGSDGRFVLPDLCDDLPYGLSLADPSLQLSGQLAVRGGEGAAGAQEHLAFRGPNGPGLYLLEDDKISRVRTWADVSEVKILRSPETVRYPMMKPTPRTKLPTVKPGTWLVVSSAQSIKDLQFHPLVPDARRRQFQGKSITDHVYIGVKFTTDTKFERLSAAVDESQVERVMSGKRAFHFMGHGALAPGRYAVMSDTDTVTSLVDFSE